MHRQYLFLTLLFLISKDIYACSCKPENSVDVEVNNVDVVIYGKVTEANFNRNGFNEYTVLVKRKYKGNELTKTIYIRTGRDPVTDCGLKLTAGKEYLLYLWVIKSDWREYDSNMKYLFFGTVCSRTKEFNKTEESAIMKTVKK